VTFVLLGLSLGRAEEEDGSVVELHELEGLLAAEVEVDHGEEEGVRHVRRRLPRAGHQLHCKIGGKFYGTGLALNFGQNLSLLSRPTSSGVQILKSIQELIPGIMF
jgi:hypothetical protein